MTNFESTFVRDPSPNNFSDDGGNSESGTTTVPIMEKQQNNPRSKPMSLGGTKGLSGGYQPINHQIGDQSNGKNAFAFWTIITLLFILTVGNLMLTLTIIGVLKLGKGMQNMELVPEAETVKFYGETDLDRVYKRDGLIEGFDEIPVTITGESSSVILNLVNRMGHTHTKMIMGRNGTHFKGINQFEIKNPTTGETVFTTQRPRYNIPKSIRNLKGNSVSVSRISSPIDEDLKFVSKGKLMLRGVEGTQMESKELLWSADQNIHLKSLNGTIVLMAANGVYLDTTSIPIVTGEHGIKTSSAQYKICVCMPQGKLFRVQVPRIHNAKNVCTHFNPRHDPCAN